MSAITPVLCAKERILLYRIGPSQSTLFIAYADGSDERPLLPNAGFDYNASFSAEGKWIIFTSERGGSADIYRVHPDGSGLERLTDDPAYDDQGALSPDGKQLAFVSSRGNHGPDVGSWRVPVVDIHRNDLRIDQFSDSPGRARVILMRTDGADVRRITSVGKFAGSSSTQMSADPICKVQQLRLLQDLPVQLLPGGRNKTAAPLPDADNLVQN